MKRENPFLEIYKKVNVGESNQEKQKLFCQDKNRVPQYLDIELTNACNIHCNMCPVGTGMMKRKTGFMNEEVFNRVCEDVKKFNIPAVRFIRWGEPTLHPKFLEYLTKIKKECNVKVHFNTNGMLLTPKVMEEVVNAGIDSVKFSFQGVNSISYNEMRSGGGYEKLIDNMKLFCHIRGENLFPYISCTTTTTYESESEIADFKKMIANYCDEVGVGKTKMKFVDLERMNLSDDRKLLYLGYIKHEKGIMRRMKVCPELWDKMSIDWDGTVSGCCMDYDRLMAIGNILEDNLLNIFHSEKAMEYRTLLCNGEYNSLALCKDCFEYIPLKK